MTNSPQFILVAIVAVYIISKIIGFLFYRHFAHPNKDIFSILTTWMVSTIIGAYVLAHYEVIDSGMPILYRSALICGALSFVLLMSTLIVGYIKYNYPRSFAGFFIWVLPVIKKESEQEVFSLTKPEQEFIDQTKFVQESNGFIREKTFKDERWYQGGSIVFFILTFFASWIYCISTYGYLLGFGLGWIPSLILGGIVASIWPIALFLIIILVAGFSYLVFSPS